MAGTTANVAGIELQVDDLERAEAFYTAVLGLGVRARESHDDFQEVIVCGDGDSGYVCLVNRSPAEGDTGVGSRTKVILKSDDVAASYEATIAAGGTPIDEPKFFESDEWSIWFATLHDPDGHKVQLVGRHARDGT